MLYRSPLFWKSVHGLTVCHDPHQDILSHAIVSTVWAHIHMEFYHAIAFHFPVFYLGQAESPTIPSVPQCIPTQAVKQDEFSPEKFSQEMTAASCLREILEPHIAAAYSKVRWDSGLLGLFTSLFLKIVSQGSHQASQ